MLLSGIESGSYIPIMPIIINIMRIYTVFVKCVVRALIEYIRNFILMRIDYDVCSLERQFRFSLD